MGGRAVAERHVDSIDPGCGVTRGERQLAKQHFDLGRVGDERGEQLGGVHHRQRADEAEGEHPGVRAHERAGEQLGLGGGVHGGARLLEERGPGGGEAHAAGVAHEQLHPKLLLELRDRL